MRTCNLILYLELSIVLAIKPFISCVCITCLWIYT